MTLYPNLIREVLQTVIYAGTKKNLIESEKDGDPPSGAHTAHEKGE